MKGIKDTCTITASNIFPMDSMLQKTFVYTSYFS